MAAALLVKATVFSSPQPILLPLDEACSLSRGACGAALPDGSEIKLVFAPRPIPANAPFDVEVQVAGSQASPITVEITATDPPMGSSRTPLSRSGMGLYRGQASLPACISGHGQWRAMVEMESEGQVFHIPFRFETGPGGQ
jgi:hypothetical protein